MRVLVCGGREFKNAAVMKSTMEGLKVSEIIHGGARGADSLANDWAVQNHIPVRVFPADWDAHGRAAGPIRNAKMLSEGKPDMVVAFPGSSGTADMVRRAEKAGVQVIFP